MTLANDLAVFHEPRTPSDRFDSVFPSAHTDTVEGTEQYGRSRLLVRRFGPDHLGLVGIPTVNGWVCPHFVYPSGEEGDGGPCWSMLRNGVSFSIDGDDRSYQLYGVAADDVESVAVVAQGKQFPAQIGRNGFVFATTPTALCPTEIESVIVEHRSGERSEIQLEEVSSLPGSSGAILGCR